jgi:hypothetical protein
METQLEAPNPTPLFEVVLRAHARPLRRERLTNRDECTCEPKARVHEERSF